MVRVNAAMRVQIRRVVKALVVSAAAASAALGFILVVLGPLSW